LIFFFWQQEKRIDLELKDRKRRKKKKISSNP